MKSNRQIFFSILLACCAIAAHGQYGVLSYTPDFSNALPVSEIEASDVEPLLDGQVWTSARLTNWKQFFRESEEVETQFYYQRSYHAPFFLMLETEVSDFDEMYWSMEFLGIFYLVTWTDEVRLITKIVRTAVGYCHYQKVEFFEQLPSIVVVSFEPPEFGNVIQTSPLHYQKQFADVGFISANLTKGPDSWIVNLWSEEVEILELIDVDDYTGELETVFVGDSLRIHFMDVAAISKVLLGTEEFMFNLKIQE